MNPIKKFFYWRITLLHNKIEKRYARKLEKKTPPVPIPVEDYEKIRSIEKKVFPEGVFQEYSYEQFLMVNLCFSYSQLHYKIFGNTYIIWSEHFGYNMLNCVASEGDFDIKTAVYLVNLLKQNKKKIVWAYIRDKYAYPFIEDLVKKKRIRIIRDKIITPGEDMPLSQDDFFHDMIFKIIH